MDPNVWYLYALLCLLGLRPAVGQPQTTLTTSQGLTACRVKLVQLNLTKTMLRGLDKQNRFVETSSCPNLTVFGFNLTWYHYS
jgi:hypothetical protein